MSTPDIPAGHARAATPEELTGRWRQGMSNPFSVYVQLGDEPSKEEDPFVGSLVSPEAAAAAVAAQNADRSAKRLVAAAWDDGARAERARIAEAAAEMATTLTRPGMGHGPGHGEQVRVVRLDELLDLLGDDGDGEQT